MNYRDTIRVKDDPELVYNAFLPDNNRELERAKYSVKKEGSEVVFEISASDAVAFRAFMTSLTKMLAVIEKTKKI